LCVSYHQHHTTPLTHLKSMYNIYTYNLPVLHWRVPLRRALASERPPPSAPASTPQSPRQSADPSILNQHITAQRERKRDKHTVVTRQEGTRDMHWLGRVHRVHVKRHTDKRSIKPSTYIHIHTYIHIYIYIYSVTRYTDILY
jgi:hypothetical protein